MCFGSKRFRNRQAERAGKTDDFVSPVSSKKTIPIVRTPKRKAKPHERYCCRQTE
jgi:hypothetical protein